MHLAHAPTERLGSRGGSRAPRALGVHRHLRVATSIAEPSASNAASQAPVAPDALVSEVITCVAESGGLPCAWLAAGGGAATCSGPQRGPLGMHSTENSGITPPPSASPGADRWCAADNGLRMTGEEKQRVDVMLDQLAEAGKQQQPRPLDNDLLWGDYEVAYTTRAKARKGDNDQRRHPWVQPAPAAA